MNSINRVRLNLKIFIAEKDLLKLYLNTFMLYKQLVEFLYQEKFGKGVNETLHYISLSYLLVTKTGYFEM